jgi:hypothetical protein
MYLRHEDYVIPTGDLIYHEPQLMTPRLVLARQRLKADSYISALAKMLRKLPDTYQDRPFLTQFGDIDVRLAGRTLVLAKSHRLGAVPTVLLPFDWRRHFSELRELMKEGDKRSLEAKQPVAYWRGGSTNRPWDPSVVNANPRMELVRRWANSTSVYIDVGLTGLVEDATDGRWRPHWEKYVKPRLKWKKQLQFRYLISAEGNDVASGLKWQLGSNSVVLMPPPTVEIWTMESCLEPWVHYVPVKKDFSDLEDRILECERDLDRCRKISEAATEFVRWYADEDRAMEVGAARLQQYLDRVRIEHPD